MAFVPDHTAHSGAHVRDAIDLKRTMVTVIFAMVPALLFGMWNIGFQANTIIADANIVLNDEAHYLVQERFNTDFNEMETKRKYFFTATTKETPSDEGLGMNNVEFYGEKIYQIVEI